MYTEIIYLIKETLKQDDVGNQIPIKTETKTLAKVKSVATKEFYSAVEIGIRPTFEFVVRETNYDNQTLLRYKNAEYSIVRTIKKPDNQLVLVVSSKTSNIDELQSR